MNVNLLEMFESPGAGESVLVALALAVMIFVVAAATRVARWLISALAWMVVLAAIVAIVGLWSGAPEVLRLWEYLVRLL